MLHQFDIPTDFPSVCSICGSLFSTEEKLNFLNHLWKPTIMKPLKYEDKEYEILIQNHVFIKDKKTNSYYRNNMNSIDEKC